MGDYDNLVEAILSGNAVIFLGAGASSTSLLKDNQPVPLGNKLGQILYQKFFPNENYDGESQS